MKKKMETTIEYWGYVGIMENELETTIVYCSALDFLAIAVMTPLQAKTCLVSTVWGPSTFGLQMVPVRSATT